jgi:alpha-ribazole phosphatase
MTGVTHWWWVRHAPVADGTSRLYGRLDVPCDCSNLAAFEALAEVLPGDAVWVVSSLLRARQTFEAIRAFRPALAEPLTRADFDEQDFGAWQGLSWNDMQAKDGDAYQRFWQDPTGNAPPQGESFAAVIKRVAAGISDLNRAYRGRSIVAIAHGGSIRAAVAVALKLSPAIAMAIVIDNLSVTRLDHLDGGGSAVSGSAWRVHGVNLPCPWPPA